MRMPPSPETLRAAFLVPAIGVATWQCISHKNTLRSNLIGMDRREMHISDAATLMTLLHRGKRPSTLRTLLPGWDMLQVDVPSREQMETAMSILVGSGLAEVDSSWGMLLTEDGERIRRSVKGWQGMRTIPSAIEEILAGRQLNRAPLTLSQSVFDEAREEYYDAARRRAERAQKRRSRNRWWWPDPSRRPGQ